jgi:hypothetical protein
MYSPYRGTRIRFGLDFFPKGFSQTELAENYYHLIADRAKELLLYESASFEEIDAEYNPGEILTVDIFEAITVKTFARTQQKMEALQKVFNKYLAESGTTALTPIVGQPKTSGMFASVTVQIPLSDGQVISIIFHSPEGDKKKITATDEIIAYRWLLNKRDITQVVSPEEGQDVSLETLGQRVSQLVAKNSAKFQAQQKGVAEQKVKMAELQTTVQEREKANQDLMAALKDNQDRGDQLEIEISNAIGLLAKVKEHNQGLEDRLAQLKAQQAAAKGREGGTKAGDTSAGEGDIGGTPTQDDFQIKQTNFQNELISRGFTYNETNRFYEAKGVDKDGKPKGLTIIDGMVQGKKAFYLAVNYTGDSGAVDEKDFTCKGINGVDAMVKKALKFIDDYFLSTLMTKGTDPQPEPTPTPEPETPTKPLAEMNTDELLKAIAAGFTPERSGANPDLDKAYQLLGTQVVPGIRLQDALDAGKVYQMFSKGEMSQEEWDAYVADLKASNKVAGAEPEPPAPSEEPQAPDEPEQPAAVEEPQVTPEPEVTPPPEPQPQEPTPTEPPSIAVLNDILAGKYDTDTTKAGDLIDQAIDELEAAGLLEQYDALLNQAADHLSGLLRKKAA